MGTYDHPEYLGHGPICLYVTDKSGHPLSSEEIGDDYSGLGTVRFLGPQLVELSFSNFTGSWSDLYEISPWGQLVLKGRPPSDEARREEQKRHARLEMEWDSKMVTEERAEGQCTQLRTDTPVCAGSPPEGELKVSLAQACNVSPEDIKGVCSKEGCVGFARRGHESCVGWARAGKPTLLLPYEWSRGSPDAVLVAGSHVCLRLNQKECADVSGLVARWLGFPAGDATGDANYQVMPYAGEAPRIDGKSQEPEWKGATLWHQTAALVQEGLESWRGLQDVSAQWRFRSRGEELLFLLRVHDNRVVAGKVLEKNDAAILGFIDARQGVRFVLEPAGRVRTDALANARCAWAQVPEGYQMECAIPLAALGLKPPPGVWRAELAVEDHDGPGVPLKRLGSLNSFYVWSEFPPTWEEASRIQSQFMDHSEED